MTILTFAEYLTEEMKEQKVSGSPSAAAKTHKALIKTMGGKIHHSSSNNGVHTIIHSNKKGEMKTSEIHSGDSNNDTSIIKTRFSNDAERKKVGV